MSSPEIHSIINLRDLRPSGQQWQFEVTQAIRVGRLPRLELFLDDPSVSRYHAECFFADGNWHLRDSGSRNGTFLNGARIGASGETLHRGDVLQFGEVGIMVADVGSEQLSAKDNCMGDTADVPWDDIESKLRSSDFILLPHFCTLAAMGRSFDEFSSSKEYLNSLLWTIAEVFEPDVAAFIGCNFRQQWVEARAFLSLTSTDNREELTQNAAVLRALRQRKSLLSTDKDYSVINAFFQPSESELGLLYLARSSERPAFTGKDLRLADAVVRACASSIGQFERQLERERKLTTRAALALARALALKGERFQEQAKKVSELSILLAQGLGLPAKDQGVLRKAAALYDIGMIAITDDIVSKPSPLSPQQWNELRSHVLKGVDILESAPGLTPVIPIARSHHERWDGSGYPDRLKSDQIPLLARIMALADGFAALTSDRPHRGSRSIDEAYQIVQAESGRQFDPACVGALVRQRARIEEALSCVDDLTATLSPKTSKALLSGR